MKTNPLLLSVLIAFSFILLNSCEKDIDKQDSLKSIYSSKVEKYFDEKILSFSKEVIVLNFFETISII